MTTKSAMTTKSGNQNERESVSSWRNHDHDCRSVCGEPFYSSHLAYLLCPHDVYFFHVDVSLTQIGHEFLSLYDHMSWHSYCAQLKDLYVSTRSQHDYHFLLGLQNTQQELYLQIVNPNVLCKKVKRGYNDCL